MLPIDPPTDKPSTTNSPSSTTNSPSTNPSPTNSSTSPKKHRTKVTPTLFAIKVSYNNGKTSGTSNFKMYNTTSLSFMHDKISERLRGLNGKNDATFVITCGDRTIEENDTPDVIGDLPHPNDVIELVAKRQ
jgi:hypothetical protein